MIRLKRYSRPYNSLLLLTIVILLACGPIGPTNEFPGYFMPQSGNTPTDALPYFYSPDVLYVDYYTYDEMGTPHKNDPNLSGWRKNLGVKTNDSVAAAFIYEGKDDSKNPLYQAIQKKPAEWRYLLTARKIQHASESHGTWWDRKPADTQAMRKLYDTVKNHLKTSSDPFLKDKYAFQTIKLAHELHHYDSCVAYYNRYFGKRETKNIMNYWSLSRKGGALLDKGDTAQAVYIFSQIYAQCPTRRKQAYMSLRLNHIRFVPGALQYCKNKQEKLAVYTLGAIQPWQDALPILEKMVKLDPNHPYLELIMGREINKNEEDYYYRRNWEYKYYDQMDTTKLHKKKEKAGNYFEKLNLFATQCAENPKIKDKAFWYTATAYINYVLGHLEQSGTFLSKAERTPTSNPVLKQQILLQKLLLTTDEAKSITSALEQKVLPLLDSIKNTQSFYKNNALVYSSRHLATLYKQASLKTPTTPQHWWSCNRQKQKRDSHFYAAKSYILQLLSTGSKEGWFMNRRNANRIEDTASNHMLNDVIAFFSQQDPSSEDRQFMKLTGLNLNYLYWVLGRKYMGNFQYKMAVNACQHVADTFWHQSSFKSGLAANPFATQIKDTHAPTPADTVKYTPFQFARHMQALSIAVRKKPQQAAENYYRLGCGAYNMSFYGNSWLLVKRNWSSSDMPYGIDSTLTGVDSLNYYTTFQARAYFDSAMQKAQDPELAAKACFMAAKCEQKDFYIVLTKDDNKLWYAFNPLFSFYGGKDKDSLKILARQIEDSHYHHYFKELNSKYSHTQYASEVIRQCAVYRDFVEGK